MLKSLIIFIIIFLNISINYSLKNIIYFSAYIIFYMNIKKRYPKYLEKIKKYYFLKIIIKFF